MDRVGDLTGLEGVLVTGLEVNRGQLPETPDLAVLVRGQGHILQ